MMPTNLKELAIAVMAEHDEETTGSVALDNLINAAMAHDCKADALRARVRTLEGALRVALEWLEVAERKVNDNPANGPGALSVPGLFEVRNGMSALCATLSGAQPDTTLDSTKSQLDEMRPGPEELARFWDEWALKDGNSPGYNNQKAKNYGAQANAFRLRAESAESALAEREASIVELRRALEDMLKRQGSCGSELPWDGRAGPDPMVAAEAALAQPAPQAALRAILVKAIKEATKDCGRDCGGTDDYESTADAVLKGES